MTKNTKLAGTRMGSLLRLKVGKFILELNWLLEEYPTKDDLRRGYNEQLALLNKKDSN